MNNVHIKLQGRKKGLHIYLAIDNLDEIIQGEERKCHEVKRSLKLLDTFFVLIRRHVTKPNLYPGLVLEKVTGNRMHLYLKAEEGRDESSCLKDLMQISVYAYKTLAALNRHPKLELIQPAVLRVGADFGWFNEMEIAGSDAMPAIEEDTTVGYAANYACKLQIIARDGYLAISEDDFPMVPGEYKPLFSLSRDPKLAKYHRDGSDKYFKASIRALAEEASKHGMLHFDENEVKEAGNRINLADMQFRTCREKADINRISEQDAVRFNGCVLMADVRGFTANFKEDDSNLEEMSRKAASALTSMINECLGHGGTHIQVQGDKEVAIFPVEAADEDGTTLLNALNAAFTMIDEVHDAGLRLGIGISYGYAYASRIDTRGVKDPVIIGSVVTEANSLEDDYAHSDEIAISEALYRSLSLPKSKHLQKYFTKSGGHYVTTAGFGMRKVRDNEEMQRLQEDERRRNYYGPHLRED